MADKPNEEHADFCTCPACEAKRNPGKIVKPAAPEEHHDRDRSAILRQGSPVQRLHHLSTWDTILIIIITVQLLTFAWELISVIKGNSSLSDVVPVLVINGVFLAWNLAIFVRR